MYQRGRGNDSSAFQNLLLGGGQPKIPQLPTKSEPSYEPPRAERPEPKPLAEEEVIHKMQKLEDKIENKLREIDTLFAQKEEPSALVQSALK